MPVKKFCRWWRSVAMVPTADPSTPLLGSASRDDKERVVAHPGSCDWDVWTSSGKSRWIPKTLAVFDDGLEEGAVFEEIYQAGPNMIDVVVHCSLCRFTIVCFEGLQDRQVGI